MIYCFAPSIEQDNRVRIGKPIKEMIFGQNNQGFLNYKGKSEKYSLRPTTKSADAFRISFDTQQLKLTGDFPLIIIWTDNNDSVIELDTINNKDKLLKTDFKWVIYELYKTEKTQNPDINANHKPYLKITDKEANSIWQKWILSELGNNSILFGPPGTGKTFQGNRLAKVISIKKENQLNITFHQSMTYEDMIEGIKPVLDNSNIKYEVVDGSIKKIAYKALAEYLSVTNKTDYSLMKSEVISRYHDDNYHEEVRKGRVYMQLIDDYMKIFDSFPVQIGNHFLRDELETLQSISNNPTNINSENINDLVSDIFDMINNSKTVLNNFFQNINNNFDSIKDVQKENRCRVHKDSIGRLHDNLILLFDKSICFDSHRFLLTLNISLTIDQKITLLANSIQGYLSNLAGGNSQANKEQAVILVASAGELLSNLSEVLSKSSEIRNKILLNGDTIGLYNKGICNIYVILIDEINRGNVSQIFGELITLIEEDKRYGEKNAISVTLPYSGESFIVPPNLYIIGTMNTADRSVEALDTALRRRFVFTEMKPDYSLLDDVNVEKINISKMLRKMNEEISKIKSSRDYEIGHAYFWPLKENPSLDKLKAIFANSILPLLKEYFYGDYSSIKNILNEIDTDNDPVVLEVTNDFYDVQIENIYNKDADYFIRIYSET